MVYQPDIGAMRQQYAGVLAEQQRKALRGVQDIYAQRGTTGGGSEALAFGEGQQQFGLGAGQAEAGLQQYLGNLGMQQAGLEQQASQFGQTLGEGQRQFNIGQFGQAFGAGGPAAGQQTLGAQGQQFGQNMSLANLYAQGYLGQSPFQAGSPFASMQTAQQIDPMNQIAQQHGLGNAAYMSLVSQLSPTAFEDILQNPNRTYDVYGYDQPVKNWGFNYAPQGTQPQGTQPQGARSQGIPMGQQAAIFNRLNPGMNPGSMRAF